MKMKRYVGVAALAALGAMGGELVVESSGRMPLPVSVMPSLTMYPWSFRKTTS